MMSRMSSWLRRLSAATVAVLATGCGGGGGEKTEIAIDQLNQEIARVYCASIYKCCKDDDIAAIEQTGQFDGEADCRTKTGSFLLTWLVTPMQNATTAKTGTYDPKKAYACVQAADVPGCNGSFDVNKFFENCESPWKGTVAVGQPCVSAAECATYPICSGDPKKCQQPLAANATCQDASGKIPIPCPAAQWCDTDTDKTCKARIAETQTCTNAFSCASGLVCKASKCTKICTGR